MGKPGNILATILALATVSPLHAGEVPAGRATGRWQVDFGAERCVAVREFAVDGRNVIVGLEPDPDDDGMRVLFRIPAPGGTAESGYYKAKFEIDGKRVSDGLSAWPAENGGLLLFTGTSEREKLELATVREIAVESDPLTAKLPMDSMPKVRELLSKCNSGLLESWGFSKAEQERLHLWPVSRMATYFRDEDYPREAIAKGEQGEVRVRLLIGTDGRVQQCKLRFSSGSAALDEATCKRLTAAGSFEPARAKDGRPMAAPAFASIRWILPSW